MICNRTVREISRFVLSVLVLLTLTLGYATSAEAAQGRTPGTFSVSSTGSANYTIPIWAPPGPRGMQPAISLNYNSGAPIGTLGLGWSVTGLGSITRCPKTQAQDGGAAPVALVTYDGYCLNGNRLRLISGTYGAAGSVYETEVADFSQITAEGTVGNGPAYFTVQATNGLTYEYGFTDGNGNGANSQVLASGTALTWLLSKVIDRAGNNFVINYTTLSGTVIGTAVPLQILWTPIAAGSSAYTYTMQFNYSGNVPQSSPNGYVGGAHVSNPELLTSIEILASGAVVKDYFLGYQSSPVTGRKELISVKECADSGQANCLLPTSITYTGGTPGVSATANTALSSAGPHLTARYDLNGDGYPDIVYEASDSSAWYVSFGSPTGYGSPVNIGINANVNGNVLIGRLTGGAEDGVLANNNGTWYYYSWNGAQFTGTSAGIAFDSSNSGYELADINGDGLPDLIELIVTEKKVGAIATVSASVNTSAGGILSFASATTAFTSGSLSGAELVTPDMQYSKLRRYDFNGDGQDDLVLLTITGSAAAGYVLNTNELISTGNTFSSSQIASVFASTYVPVYFTNWNDDACTDFVTGNVLYVAGCNGTAATTFTISGTVLGTMDWDGDGRTDLLVSDGSNIGVYLSTGSGVSGLTATSIPYASSCVYVTMNAVGGGLDDLGCWSQSGSNPLTYYLHNGAPDLVSEFEDGYGNYAAPSYVALVQAVNSVYFPRAQTYPYQEYLGPLYLVNSVTFSDSSSSTGTGTYTQSHYYSGATVSLTGRGFMGMQAHQVNDSRNGIWETWEYGVTFPYAGMLGADIQTLNNTTADTIFSRVLSLSYKYLSTTADEEVYFPSVSNDLLENYEVGGPKNSQLVKTTSTNYTFDNYGNPTTIATTVTDNDASSPYSGDSWTTTTTNTPDVDTAHWCLNLYTETQVAYTASIGGAVTRTRQFVPDTTNCRYTSVVTEPSSSSYKVTETLGFDSFGNINSDSVTGVNMTSRAMSASWGTAGQFPMSFTDASGATTQLNYNFSFGLPSSQTDANGVTTSWSYDAFGRKAQEIRPDNTSTSWTYNPCSGCDPKPRMTITQTQLDTGGNAIRSTATYTDMLDRVIYQAGTEISGTTVWSTVRYFDSLGRVVSSSMPYATSGSSPGATTYSYDILNRITAATRPISATNSTLQSTGFAYEGRTTIVTDALSNARTIVTDVNGLQRQTKDANGYTVTLAYDAAGSETGVTDSLGNTLWGSATYAYGIAPFLLGATDMDRGAWTYTYDALGELTSWHDPDGNQSAETYDALSRPLTRTEAESFTQWTWGSSSASHNIGKLQSACWYGGQSCVAKRDYSESETYDNLGRLSTRTISLPSPSPATGTYTWQYNATTGLLDTLTYPTMSGYALQLKYGYAYGILQSITDISDSPNVAVWTANATDPAGHVIQETLGNGIQNNRAFDAVTGWLNSTQAGVGGGTGVKNLGFLYDLVGNVSQRQDNNLGLTENFYYDNDYRLSTSKLNGAQNLAITYDVMGDITSRSDVGGGATWTYDPVRKHAVTQAGSSSYQYSYDADGNMVSRQGNSISWTSFGYPSAISTTGQNPETVAFVYGPDRRRTLQSYSGNGVTESTDYLGGLMEVVASGGTTTYRDYIIGNGSTVAIYSYTATGGNTINYLLTDHQASVSAITNSAGGVAVSESYTPFGARRNPITWSGAAINTDLTASAAITRQGYTGQTQLGLWMGLNHMNGRVEDAITGRFLSADPYIPESNNTQSYNRYSYVNNGPLSYIDPSGFDDTCNGSDGDDGDNDGDSDGNGSDNGNSGGSNTPNTMPASIRTHAKDTSTCGASASAPVYTGSRLPGAPMGDLSCSGGCWQWSPTSLTVTDLTTGESFPAGDPGNGSWFYVGGSSTFIGGSSFGGPGGSSPGGKPQGGQSQNWSWSKIQSWLCTAGNSVASGANSLSNMSGKLELAGLGGAGVGVLTAQPEIVGAGLAAASTGGVGNITAGVMQLTAGILQGVGGGGFSNSGYALVSLGTGVALARGIVGSAASGYRTVSQRAADAFANGGATVAGGTNDLVGSLVDAAAPQQVSCPGGN